MKIGYVGLGSLGGALARRFLAQHELTVWDRDPAALARFTGLGAQIAPNATELARNCDVVLLCLARSADVRQALFGDGGLADGLAAGKLVIDQSNGDPAETRDLARQLAGRGVAMMDAPVSGSPARVSEGVATVMACGPDELYERALPVLQAIGPAVLRCGARVGDAQAMKAFNNTMNAALRVSTLEVVAMGSKMGLSLECMTDILNKGSGCNHISRTLLTGLVEGKASTDVALPLVLKDLNQAIALGMESAVSMPISTAARGLLQMGVNTLGAGARLQDVVGLIASMAGARLAPSAAAARPAMAPARAPRELTVGYVGLGVMGGALARRMLLSRPLHVFDARPEAARELEPLGAIVAPDLPSLARACDVIMLCVPTSAVGRKVIFGQGGLAEGLGAGKIVVDQTTGDPTEARRMASELREIGVALVDAPVAGGPRGAQQGTIALYYGGAEDVFGQVRPLLESISPNVVFCGDTGNGHVAKLVNAAVASTNRLITYECAAAAFKYGLAVAAMDRVINRSSGWSCTSERILPVLAAHGQSANFQLQLMVKDLRLGSRMAMDGGAPMVISSVIRSLYEVGVNRIGAANNLDDMATLFEDAGGFRFAPA